MLTDFEICVKYQQHTIQIFVWNFQEKKFAHQKIRSLNRHFFVNLAKLLVSNTV